MKQIKQKCNHSQSLGGGYVDILLFSIFSTFLKHFIIFKNVLCMLQLYSYKISKTNSTSMDLYM